jgi:nucleotide-binding universal stress UspA family protein
VYKNILVPLDGSRFAEKSLDEISNIWDTTKIKLILFHVIEIYPLLPRDKKDEYIKLHKKGESYLNNIKVILEKKGVKNIEMVIQQGKPSHEICQYSKRDDIDLVLITTHGLGEITKWTLGSVTYDVSKHVNKPLIIIRA